MHTTCSQTLRNAEFMIKAVKRAYSSINSEKVAKMPALVVKTSTSTLKTSLVAGASMADIGSISSKNKSRNTSRRQMCSNSI